VVTFFGQVLVALPLAALGAWFVALMPRERQALASRLALRRFTSEVR